MLARTQGLFSQQYLYNLVMKRSLFFAFMFVLWPLFGCGGGSSTSQSAEAKFSLVSNEEAYVQKDGFSQNVQGTLILQQNRSEVAAQCQGGPPRLSIGYPGLSVPTPPSPILPVSTSELEGVEMTADLLVDSRDSVTFQFPSSVSDPTFVQRMTFETVKRNRSRLNLLSLLKPGEKRLLLDNPGKATGFIRASLDAEATRRTLYGADCDSDRGNAFKHSFWSFRLAQECGIEFANKITNAHEDFEGNDARTKTMDLHNNAVGLKLFAQHPTAFTVVGAVLVITEFISQNPIIVYSTYLPPITDRLVALRASCDEPIVPADSIVVDDQQPSNPPSFVGFYKGGSPHWWRIRNIGFAGKMTYTMSNGGSVDNNASWRPNLPVSGDYLVEVFIPSNYADTRSAKYKVVHSTGETDVVVNQSIYFDAWVEIGTYHFNAGTSGFVTLNDMTGEAYGRRMIGFDAIRFTPR